MNIYMNCTLWTSFQAQRDWINLYQGIGNYFPSILISVLWLGTLLRYWFNQPPFHVRLNVRWNKCLLPCMRALPPPPLFIQCATSPPQKLSVIGLIQLRSFEAMYFLTGNYLWIVILSNFIIENTKFAHS